MRSVTATRAASAALREVLAAYLRRVRGAVADPERLVICSGFAQGLNLILRALARQGVRRVAVEDPGDLDQPAIAARAGLQAVPVRVDEDGVDVAALAASDARAVVLTPAHQSPTGVVLAPQRRQALVAWANDRDATIIEDDYDAEFRYDREPVGAVQGLAPDRVALLGTVSKSLAPAMRLGWIVCPPRSPRRSPHEKDLDDRGSPGLDQLALATLIESGRYDRHLRRMRASYARRRATLVDALTEHAPQVELRGLAAGFHAVAHLPDSLSEPAVVSAAGARSIGLYGMSRYRSSGATARHSSSWGSGTSAKAPSPRASPPSATSYTTIAERSSRAQRSSESAHALRLRLASGPTQTLRGEPPVTRVAWIHERRAAQTRRRDPDRASTTTPSRPHQPATENDATTDSRARRRPGALGRRWAEVARAHRRHRAAGAGRLSQLRRSRDWVLGHLAGGRLDGRLLGRRAVARLPGHRLATLRRAGRTLVQGAAPSRGIRHGLAELPLLLRGCAGRHPARRPGGGSHRAGGAHAG